MHGMIRSAFTFDPDVVSNETALDCGDESVTQQCFKERGAIVLFGNQPFTTLLITSNLDGFKYCWQWDKKIPAGMSYARFRPMQQTEDIAVFTNDGGSIVYYPQMVKRDKPIKAGGMVQSESASSIGYKALKLQNNFFEFYESFLLSH